MPEIEPATASGAETSGPTDLVWLAGMAAGVGFILLAVQNLYVIAAPIQSDDLWWHLRLGEAYAAAGPWLDADPLLYTAATPPPPHSWLFDLLVAGISRAWGLIALRPPHVLAVVGVLALAYSILRREAATRSEAFLALGVFFVLALSRLTELRPQLFTVGAVLLFYRLLLENRNPPSWRRVAAAAALVCLWANVHAAFLLGPLLLVAALAGLVVHPVLARWQGGDLSRERRPRGPSDTWLVRISAALGLSLFAALLNPRGIEQHLALFSASDTPSVQRIGEWWAFNPMPSEWSWRALGSSVGALTDLVMLGYVIAAIFMLRRLLKSRDSERHCHDLLLCALGGAGIVALLLAQRFVWLSFFPLLCILRALAPVSKKRVSISVAAAGIAVSGALYETRHFRVPSTEFLRTYMGEAFSDKYPTATTHFLQQAQLRGNLFVKYSGGGFLGYWLAPQLRTMVNGTMNFPNRVFEDYLAVVDHRGATGGETFRDALERNEVDVFVGNGIPEEPVLDVGLRTPRRFYTTATLEREPGWVLVHRSLDTSVYLRRSNRNQENLRRVTDYYAAQAIPFDSERGLDVREILRAHRPWAVRHGMIPRSYELLLRAMNAQEASHQIGALELLATIHLLLGDYVSSLALDRRALAQDPTLEAPRRRMVFALLRLGRAEDAVRVGEALTRVDEDGARSRKFLGLAREIARLDGLEREVSAVERDSLDRFVLRLPVLSWERFHFELRTYLAPKLSLVRSP